MGLKPEHIRNSSFVENEIKHIRNIEDIVKKSVFHIDKEIDNIGFLDDDVDYTSPKDITIEFSYIDLRLWIDINIKNYSYFIELVDIKDNDDNDCLYLSKMLTQDLTKYYDKEGIQRTYSYNQALEIQHDQSDPHNIIPKMPSGYGVNLKYVQDIKSICEDDESRIIMFIKHGYAGSRLTMRNRLKPVHAVRIILPMIINNTFEQVSSLSSRQEIARFIYDNFESYNGTSLNYRTIENNISKNYYAC